MPGSVSRDDILAHLARYRLSTHDVLKNLFYPESDNDRALQSHLKRLMGSGDVASAPLYAKGNQVYYHLTSQGAVSQGLPKAVGGPISHIPNRVRALAVLLFCTGGVRPRLTWAELHALFPGLYPSDGEAVQHFQNGDFFIDEDEQGTRRFARIAVDAGRKPEEAAQAYERLFNHEAEWFPRFYTARRLALAIISPTPKRSQEIRRALEAPGSFARGHELRVLYASEPSVIPLLARHDA